MRVHVTLPMRCDVLFRNARVATLAAGCGDEWGMVAGRAAIAVSSGVIKWVGPEAELDRNCIDDAVTVHNLGGRFITPSLIDCHTHVVYGGQRATEWELKLKGATYEEVAQAGGGIVNTVDGTRASTVEDLIAGAAPRVRALMSEGVTALEVKSGYGLNVETERNMLLAARAIGERFDLTVRTTYLGAHAVPRESADDADAYIDEVVRDMEVLVDEGLVDCVDAFCETIGFSPAQTRRVFERAASLGVPVRLHGDQLNDLGSAELAAECGALSCDHCEYTSQAGVDAMAAAGTVAVLLPVANYFIKETQRPPVEAFRAAGVPMALATNCNPGSAPCSSLLLALNMGCTLFGMTPAEALAGVTRNAAAAMGLGRTHGTIEVGKAADFAVWRVGELSELAYFLGLNQLDATFRGGMERTST